MPLLCDAADTPFKVPRACGSQWRQLRCGHGWWKGAAHCARVVRSSWFLMIGCDAVWNRVRAECTGFSWRVAVVCRSEILFPACVFSVEKTQLVGRGLGGRPLLVQSMASGCRKKSGVTVHCMRRYFSGHDVGAEELWESWRRRSATLNIWELAAGVYLTVQETLQIGHSICMRMERRLQERCLGGAFNDDTQPSVNLNNDIYHSTKKSFFVS